MTRKPESNRIGLPCCGCTIGHEWTLALLGATVPFAIPLNLANIGVNVYT